MKEKLLDLFEGNESYEVTYNGKGVSLNDYYSSSHWSNRHRLVKKYKPMLQVMLEKAGVPQMEEYAMVILYNSRHDPDNVVGLEKLVLDTMKKMGLIIDDSKKYYKFMAILPEPEFKQNTFEFNIVKIK